MSVYVLDLGQYTSDDSLDVNKSGYVGSSKSTSGYLMNVAGRGVSQQSRLQKCVALSITGVEYIATVKANKKILWMKNL